MIDITIKAYGNDYDAEKVDMKFSIDPASNYLNIEIKDKTYVIEKRDIEMISNIIGGYDDK
jgi:hypothetical protein